MQIILSFEQSSLVGSRNNTVELTKSPVNSVLYTEKEGEEEILAVGTVLLHPLPEIPVPASTPLRGQLQTCGYSHIDRSLVV